MTKVAILASGSGSNFEALTHASRRGELAGDVSTLLCDRDDAPALARAKRLGIEALCPPTGRFRTRLEDESPWIEALRTRGIELVLLAGFMRRLHTPFLSAFPDRVINVHPSLLPAYPGRHALRDAWIAGEATTGCTIHLVNEAIDAGPIIAQEAVPIREGESFEALEARVHETEHRLYPAAVRRFLTVPWTREGDHVVFAKEPSLGA